MDIRYFWVGDNDSQDVYFLGWYPRQENLVNYQSKHHPSTHHTTVQPYHQQEKIFPLEHLATVMPSTLKGCAGALKDEYICITPLPRVPMIQSVRPMMSPTQTPALIPTTTGIPLHG